MTSPSIIDPVDFAGALIRRPSITPVDAGAMDMLQRALEDMGFVCRRYPFGQGAERVDNLYARLGKAKPNFCFAGHTDVVPEGERSGWDDDPFAGHVRDGALRGRGAADMKGAIAAFVGALSQLIQTGWSPPGSISFLITGDEEGPAINGTRKLLEAITQDGEVIDHCLVGEPTNPNGLGDMLKNGRRGSINTVITVTGRQGHVAYPQRASNPVPVLIQILSQLTERELDAGDDFFQPSNLEVTTVDVGNPTENMIPETASARFNIRFNTHHSGASLSDWIQSITAYAQEDFDGQIDTVIRISGESFMTPPGRLTDIIQTACEDVTGRRPDLSTSGGTSDARFICNYAPVAEFGLVGATMHQLNEHVAVDDIYKLRDIYAKILRLYFT